MFINVTDGSFAVYIARPSNFPSPVVVVLQEIFGVNADIRATCDKLASRGYIAIAPDLFWREAPGLDLNSWSESDWTRGLALYQHYDLDRGVLDVAATIDTARSIPGSSNKVGMMGFCLGGLMTFLTAARTEIDAAVSYYGGGIEAHLVEAAHIGVPLLMHFGAEDEFIPKNAQEQIKLAFSGSSNAEIMIYSECSHAFARHTGSHYDAAAAASANTRTYAFFDDHLKAAETSPSQPRS